MLNLIQSYLKQRKARRYDDYRQWFQSALLADLWTTVKCPACQSPVAHLQADYCWHCGIHLGPLQGGIETEPIAIPEKQAPAHDERIVSLVRTQHSMPRIPRVISPIRAKSLQRQLKNPR